jgi:hypothetical protein
MHFCNDYRLEPENKKKRIKNSCADKEKEEGEN